jgi:hypothetical protein
MKSARSASTKAFNQMEVYAGQHKSLDHMPLLSRKQFGLESGAREESALMLKLCPSFYL